MYSKPESYSISRSILEVYKTDEENFEPYTPKSSYDDNEDSKEEKNTEESEEEDEEEVEESEEGFSLHQGEILETYFYGEFTSTNDEHDYVDMDNNGSIHIPKMFDLDRFYKGVRICMNKGYESIKENSDPEMNQILKGFITEESFSEDGMELSISGMSKLLEREYQFEFSQMKRSDIIKEVIKTAGLVPHVDPTGLNDEVIDYSNKGGDGDSDDEGSYSGNLPAEACKMAKKLIKGKKSNYDKANAIYKWIDANFPYADYNNSHYNEQNIYSTAISHMGQKLFNCCDHAHLSVVLLRCAGFKANYIHVYGHVYTVVYIDGKRVMFDPLGYQNRPMGTVARGYATDGTESESLGF